jgi:hypothetical protein
MITATIITIAAVAGFGYALGSGRAEGLISHRPYNNRHNDAAGARDDHFS